MTYTVHVGDCRDVLKTIPDCSIEAIVTDPPYELGFMGKSWDKSGIAYDVAVWSECLRVLKPGGHLIAFGGSRTYHRLAVAIEDAGFEIRDQLQWLYGSGFPKSLDISKALDKQAGAAPKSPNADKWKPGSRGAAPKHGTGWGTEPTTPHNWEPATAAAQQWNGWGTALKPAHEPAVLARKPFRGSIAGNVYNWGTGALNINGCRIPGPAWYRVDESTATPRNMWAGKGKQPYNDMNTAGRWPANVIIDETAWAMIDETTGGASRFYYTAKSSKEEREAGLHYMRVSLKPNTLHMAETPEHYGHYSSARANNHPTVKPVDLMRYLIRLITPPGGVVLDPFCGSGSTGCGAVVENMDFIGIDITPEYADIARRRIGWYAGEFPALDWGESDE